MKHVVIPARIVHWAIGLAVIVALGLVVLNLVRLDATAGANRELVCDLAAWNRAQIAYYEGVMTEPQAAAFRDRIAALLDEARTFGSELAETCPRTEEGR